MAQSLLAHLYTRIKGSQEDVATLALQYILSQSSELRDSFTQKIASILSVPLDTLSYRCQVTGSDLERPDMAGFDLNNQEQILFEMKFYAGLTKNQPLGYLDRIKKNGGKGLIFICPDVRRTHLWGELKDLCTERQIETVHSFCIKVDGINLAITTWADILASLNKVASDSSPDSLADLKQLDGFCAQMDRDRFIPFSDEDLSIETAQKIDRYYQVIDETIELLHSEKHLNTSIYRRTLSDYDRAGYERSIFVDDLGISLTYDRDYWILNSSLKTPFWVAICDKCDTSPWDQSQAFLDICSTFPEEVNEGSGWLALDPLTNATLDEVCQDLKRQILAYLDYFR